MAATKPKPDTMLVRRAKELGVDLHKDPRRKKGESLLEFRRRSWSIPAWTSAPIDDQVIVWRLPPLQLSAGGLIVPEDHRSPNVKGVILAMGPRAMDILKSNGIEEGHVVVFGRFSGWEAHDNTPEFARHNQVLFLKAKDILSSDDLKAALEKGEMKYVAGEDGKYRLAKVTKKATRLLPAKQSRKEKLEALAANAGTEHEAATAKRLAAKVK